MRRLIAPSLLAMLLTYTMACKRANPPAASDEPPKPTASESVSVLEMNDPHSDTQLTKGFYGLEAKSWRWTMKNFVVQLKTPAGAAQSGGTLSFRLDLPASVPASALPITLSAKVNGTALPPETYSKIGDYTYTRPVPASALSPDVSTLEFSLDKGVPPGPKDGRELGVIAINFGLTTP